MGPRDPAHQLLAAFTDRLGPLADVALRSVPWMSVTFAGARHQFAFTVPADVDVESFAATIVEEEIALRKGFVADIIVSGHARCDRGLRVKVEALTVEE